MKQIQFNNPDLFAPKDAWDRLSLAEKAEMMKVAVKHGIYDLQTIRNKYNEFAEGGDIPQTDWSYDNWKKQIALHKGIDVDGDRTYDYEGFFRKYPQEAWAMLRNDPEAHFTDEFKTVYHPTFSAASQNNEGSIYSGVKHPIFNPEGLRGGTWSPDYKSFTMSVDGYRGSVSMDDRKWYLENAEDNGVQLREADGSLPVYDGMPWAGVLPAITVIGKKHSIGGPLVDALLNEYAKGGGIHIKSSHRGRLTELKKRTGKSEAELYRTGSAATRKMITFARNARKWKHGEGGNLYDGESQDSQQLVLGKKYWQQQAAQPQRDYLAEMVEYNRKKEAERQQRVAALRRELAVRGEQIAKKKQKEYLTMSNDNTWVEKNNGREKNPHLAERAIEGAKAHAAWSEEHPVLNTLGMVAGAAPFAVMATPVLSAAGEAAYPIITNPFVDALGTSNLGADGIKDIADGEADAFTALEVLPMTRLIKPIFGNQERWRKAIYRNMRPYSYSKTLKALETPSVLFDYFSMRPLNVSEETVLPWQKVWGWFDDMPKVTDKAYGARRQAWAKYLGMPDNFEYPIYRTVGRTKEGREIVKSIPENIPLANGEQWSTTRLDKMINDVRKSAANKYDDYFGDGKYLRGNHQHIYAKDLGNDTYYFNDTWDLQPLFKYKSLPQFLRKFEFGRPIGGKPFEWSEIISPEVDFYNNNVIQQYISHTPQ